MNECDINSYNTVAWLFYSRCSKFTSLPVRSF